MNEHLAGNTALPADLPTDVSNSATAPPAPPGEAVAQHTVTAYTLTPEQLRNSEGLHRTGLVLSLASTLFGFAVLAALIAVASAPSCSAWWSASPKNALLQAAIFVPVLCSPFPSSNCRWKSTATTSRSPTDSASRAGSPGWPTGPSPSCSPPFFATLTLWGLYTLIRRSPRRWWFYAWLLTLPIMAGMVFVSPVLIDPLFNRFEPLANTNPELTAQLRSLAHSAGLDIPPSRIFLMHASDKVTTYNAYVTGFGATKRIVVWDTTARDLTLPQILFVFGHEMGHYQLHHIYLGLAFSALLSFAGFWLTAAPRRVRAPPLWRSAGSIRALGDWASLPLLMRSHRCFSFSATPLANAFSRWEEHQADAYGLSITRPVYTDAGQVAAQAFQLLGEKSYSYPNPSPLLVFWSYSHPPIAAANPFRPTQIAKTTCTD